MGDMTIEQVKLRRDGQFRVGRQVVGKDGPHPVDEIFLRPIPERSI